MKITVKRKGAMGNIVVKGSKSSLITVGGETARTPLTSFTLDEAKELREALDKVIQNAE